MRMGIGRHFDRILRFVFDILRNGIGMVAGVVRLDWLLLQLQEQTGGAIGDAAQAMAFPLKLFQRRPLLVEAIIGEGGPEVQVRFGCVRLIDLAEHLSEHVLDEPLFLRGETDEAPFGVDEFFDEIGLAAIGWSPFLEILVVQVVAILLIFGRQNADAFCIQAEFHGIPAGPFTAFG